MIIIYQSAKSVKILRQVEHTPTYLSRTITNLNLTLKSHRFIANLLQTKNKRAAITKSRMKK